jgi:hypothetical protein
MPSANDKIVSMVSRPGGGHADRVDGRYRMAEPFDSRLREQDYAEKHGPVNPDI